MISRTKLRTLDYDNQTSPLYYDQMATEHRDMALYGIGIELISMMGRVKRFGYSRYP